MLKNFVWLTALFIVCVGFLLVSQVEGQELSLTIADNHISYQANIDKSQTGMNAKTKPLHSQFYLFSRGQKFLLKEYFNQTNSVLIQNCYPLELPNQALAALSLNYFIDSQENLPLFDQPAFYVTLDDHLLFADADYSDDLTKHLVLDLRPYDTANQTLYLCAGNFGDQQLPTKVRISDISSQLIVVNDGDQVVLDDGRGYLLTSSANQQSIAVANFDWPIYFSNLELIQDFDYLLETDGSLTINFISSGSDHLHNHRYYLNCDGQKLALETIDYRLPQLVIDHLWSNWGERVLVNTVRPDCSVARNITLERW